MDGSLACKFLQGRHIQPVSTHFAITALPDWVYDMFSYDRVRGAPKVSISITSGPSGSKIVFLSRGLNAGPLSQLWLLYPDYMACMQIVNTLPVPLFPQESISSIKKRIKGALQVQFAGRGQFPRQS